MTSCRRIARLLPDAADGAAGPLEAARVSGHVRTCTACRILLARERRLSRAIEALREIEVDELFTASVLAGVPAALPARRRDRRGLALAVLAGLLALGAAAALLPGMDGLARLPSAVAPAATAEVVDPAAGEPFALAQTILLALSGLAAATPAAWLGWIPVPVLLAAAVAVLGGAVSASTLLVVAAGAWVRSRPGQAAA